MAVLSNIQQDPELLAAFEKERDDLYEIIRDRAAIFMKEAVPLKAGVRIAVCSVPKKKMYGMAAKVLKALKAVEG